MTAIIVLAFSLIGLGLVAAVLGRFRPGEGNRPAAQTGNACGECGARSVKCKRGCMAEASVKAVEYFDDEELDRYANRPSDAYTDEEAEQFREVLYTMRQGEVASWSRSLALRGINVPDQVKDELLLLISG